MKKHHSSPAAPRRRGFLTIVVIVALIVTLTMTMNMAKTLIALRNVSVEHDQRLQVEILASTFLDYARSKQSGTADYAGETIDLSTPDWQQSYPAKVTISIEPDSREIRVQAQSFSDKGQIVQSITKTSKQKTPAS
ncbi:hypothetical protein [Lacunimicrobium album]